MYLPMEVQAVLGQSLVLPDLHLAREGKPWSSEEPWANSIEIDGNPVGSVTNALPSWNKPEYGYQADV